MRSGGSERNVAALAAEHELVDERAVRRSSCAFACAMIDVLFAVGVEPRDLVRHLAVLHDAVRRLDEAEVVDPRVAARAT